MKNTWLWAMALCACGSSANQLTGSVKEVYDLAFDTVEVSRIDDYLVIEYQKGTANPPAKVVKLSIFVSDRTIAAGNTIDLTGTVGTNPRATLQRIVEGNINLGVTTGSVQFDSPPDVGKKVAGHFNITTTEPAGRTLNGNFSATVVDKSVGSR